MKIKTTLLAMLLTLFSATSLSAYATEGRTDLLTTTLGFDIIKQGEKLEKDPTDIKETDLLKFKYVCNNSEFKRDIRKNSEQFQNSVNKLCDTITNL